MNWLKSTKFWGVVVLVLALAGGTALSGETAIQQAQGAWETTALDSRPHYRAGHRHRDSVGAGYRAGCSQVSGSIPEALCRFQLDGEEGAGRGED